MACDALAAELETPLGAALAIQALLAAHRDELLGRAAIDIKPAPTEPLWSKLSDWYAATARDALDFGQRGRVVAAVFNALPDGEGSSFLLGLARSLPGDVPEVTENEAITAELRLQVELQVSRRYTQSSVDLGFVPHDADFMDLTDP